MNPTLALVWLLAACPYFDTTVPVRVLEPVEYAVAAARLDLTGSLGFATWNVGPSGPTDCRITLRAPPTEWVACHEYQHCAQGAFHGSGRRE